MIRVFHAVLFVAAAASSTLAGPVFIGIGHSEPWINALSADGSTLVGEHQNGAFRWSLDGGFQTLPGSVYSTSRAYGVSADGRLVVGGASSEAGSDAFVWDAQSGVTAVPQLQGGINPFAALAITADANPSGVRCDLIAIATATMHRTGTLMLVLPAK